MRVAWEAARFTGYCTAVSPENVEIARSLYRQDPCRLLRFGRARADLARLRVEQASHRCPPRPCRSLALSSRAGRFRFADAQRYVASTGVFAGSMRLRLPAHVSRGGARRSSSGRAAIAPELYRPGNPSTPLRSPVSLVTTDPSYIAARAVEPWQIIGTVPLDSDAYVVADRIAELPPRQRKRAPTCAVSPRPHVPLPGAAGEREAGSAEGVFVPGRGGWIIPPTRAA